MEQNKQKTNIVVDARGQSCPIPVVMTKKALTSTPSSLNVLVDNACSVENVTRFAQNQGYTVAVDTMDADEYRLKLSKN